MTGQPISNEHRAIFGLPPMREEVPIQNVAPNNRCNLLAGDECSTLVSLREQLARLRSEVERLQNKINIDSQNFELECRKAEIANLQMQVTYRDAEIKKLQDGAATFGAALFEAEAKIKRQNGYLTGCDEYKDFLHAQISRLVSGLREIRKQIHLSEDAGCALNRIDDIARETLREGDDGIR